MGSGSSRNDVVGSCSSRNDVVGSCSSRNDVVGSCSSRNDVVGSCSSRNDVERSGCVQVPVVVVVECSGCVQVPVVVVVEAVVVTQGFGQFGFCIFLQVGKHTGIGVAEIDLVPVVDAGNH